MYRSTVLFALLVGAHAAAWAADQAEDTTCISVEVNGVRTLPYECLSRQLASPQTTVSAEKLRDISPLSARNAARPTNELGLFNRSATSIRMGSNFGHSAMPQRPSSPPMQSPIIPAR